MSRWIGACARERGLPRRRGAAGGRTRPRAGVVRLRPRDRRGAAPGAVALAGRPRPRRRPGRGRRDPRGRRPRPARRPARPRRHPARRVPLAPRAGRRLQLARGGPRRAGRPLGGGVAQRGPPAPRGLPRRPAAVRPRGGPRPARRGARRGRVAGRPRPSATPATWPPTTPTSSRPSRPRSGTCCSPTPPRRCATASACARPTPASTSAWRGRGGARGRAGRSTAPGSPSCSGARASWCTPRTRCGRPTPTSSWWRRWPPPRPTARSWPRTSRSSPAGSSPPPRSPTGTAAPAP